MRTFKTICLIGLVLLGISSPEAVKPAMAIEKAKYTSLEKEDNFEIRQYDPRIVAETFVKGNLKAAGNEGFRRLFKYISGENTTKLSIRMTAPVGQELDAKKIAMTAPVEQVKRNGQWRITFLMPAEYTLETLPEPNDTRVRLVREPGHLVAVVTYSGTWSEEGYEENKARLEAYLLKRGLTKAGPPVWARYDSPFKPWFLRRNEVLIPVENF